MLAVPVDGVRKAGVEVALDLPSEGRDLVDLDAVAAVVPEPVGYPLDERLVPPGELEQPCRDLAVTAFGAIVERMADPTLPARSLSLAPQVVVRESCGAYLPRSAA